MTYPITKVIFRYDGKAQEAIAIFPENPGTASWDCKGYALGRQHFTMLPHLAMDCTRPATSEEYATLYTELSDYVGYSLEVCPELTMKMRMTREEKALS